MVKKIDHASAFTKDFVLEWIFSFVGGEGLEGLGDEVGDGNVGGVEGNSGNLDGW